MSGHQHRSLIEYCVDALDAYDASTQGVEDHINSFIQQIPGLTEDDESFVIEVFSGCVRFRSVLHVVMNGFFARDGRNILRSEGHLYQVFCYLALFRLEELGMGHFRRFVRTQDINKMYLFLRFLTDDKNIRTWMKDEWGKLYEHSFVQTTLLSPILRWQPELQEFISELKEKIDNKLKPKKKELPSTAAIKAFQREQSSEIKAFNLTKPRPRSVPMPEPIPKLHKHKPVPATTYVASREKEQLSEMKEKNRRKAEERLMEASRSQFNCANTRKSEKTRQRIQDIITEEERKLDFECHKSNPVPHTMLSENIPIKLNTAAILREGKLYQRKEDDEIRKLERLEAGEKDASAFLDWQSRMRKQDLDEQLAEIERRRLEGKLSHEEAILARQRLIMENRERVEEMKEEAHRMMQEFLQQKLKEEQLMRELVGQVMEGHQNAKEAKKKLQEYKAKIVQEVTAENKELMRQALEEAEEEMKQKLELIRQIRAMEAVPVVRQKLVDITETAGHGLLSEMSIAELKERLSLLAVANQHEEEEKRDGILASKQAKEQKLMDTLDTIAKHRTELSKAAAIRFEERKKTRQEKPKVTDPKLLSLQQQLQEKRSQRKQHQENSKIKPDRSSAQRLAALGKSKKALEASRWEELEQTKERQAKLATFGISSSQSAARVASKVALIT